MVEPHAMFKPYAVQFIFRFFLCIPAGLFDFLPAARVVIVSPGGVTRIEVIVPTLFFDICVRYNVLHANESANQMCTLSNGPDCDLSEQITESGRTRPCTYVRIRAHSCN